MPYLRNFRWKTHGAKWEFETRAPMSAAFAVAISADDHGSLGERGVRHNGTTTNAVRVLVPGHAQSGLQAIS